MIEQDILSTSRPWVEIELGPIEKSPFYRLSTVQEDTGSYDLKNGNKFISDGSALITAASINGIVPQGRHGSFTIKDISGIWPNRISDLGRYSSDMTKGPGPNLSFNFGWTGLRPNKNYSGGSTHSNQLSGFIENVKFDIGDDSAISIEIEFVAYSSIVFSDIMAFSWDDVGKSDPEKFWKTMTDAASDGEPTAIDVIAYVTNVGKISNFYSDLHTIDPSTKSGFSYSSALQRRKTIIECRSSGFKAAKLKSDNDLTSIEFGMSLSAWLNAMLDKVILDKDDAEKADKDGLAVSYERKNDEEIWINGEYWTKIIYDWKAVPDPKNKNVDEQEAITDLQKWAKEKNKREKFNTGPVFFWKSGQESYSYDAHQARVTVDTTDYTGRKTGKSLVTKKRVLNWTSDLSSYTQLFRMFKDELAEHLNTLKQQDNFDDFLKKLNKYGSIEEVEDALKDGVGAWGKIVDFFSKGTPSRDKHAALIDTVENADGLASQFEAQNDGVGVPNKDQTMNSILAQNAFKVTVEVIGDPDLGTRFQGGNTIITTDFSFGGEEGYLRRVTDKNGNTIDIKRRENLIGMFSRQWQMMSTEHTFSEDGSYITKVELIGYIPLVSYEKAKIAQLKARKQFENHHYLY